LAQPFVRNRTTWLMYLMLAFFGYFLNIFGPITPFLKAELNLTYTVSSLHFSAFALGIIGSGLTSHRLIERIGRWNSLWIGAFGLGIGSLLLIAGRTPALTIGASFVMGLVGTMMMPIVNSVLSDQHGEQRAIAYSEANVVSSLLSAVSPVLVGWLAPTVLGWRAALVVGALAALVIYFGFGKVELPKAHTPSTTDGIRLPLPLRYWVYWTALVLSVSVEFCMIFWSADYLETGLGLEKAAAAQAVSLFLVGMIIGRLASSKLVLRFTHVQIISGSLLIAGLGFLIYWTAGTPLVGVIGLCFTGLGVAPLYPLILALAVGSAGLQSVRASGLASLASGTAIFALPLILGRLADAVGIRSAYAVIIILVIADLLIIQVTARLDARKVAPMQSP
jgi:MFS family permease